MKKANFVPAPAWVGALLWAVCLPAGIAWAEPEIKRPVSGISQTLSRQDWNRSLIEKGHASERLGQKQDALADYTLAIESQALTDADQVRVLFDRGLLLDGMGRPRDALVDYTAALSLSPDFVPARNSRAGIYARLGQLVEARNDYLSALTAAGNSERHFSYFGLGQVAETQGSLTEARDFYSRALALDPHFGLAEERLSALGGSRESAPQEHPVSMAEARGNVLMAGSGAGRRDVQVQLGAWRTEQKAARGWDRAKALASDVLKGAAPRIVTVDLPGVGRFYRLRVAVEHTGSRSLCGALTARGLDCLLVHD